MQVSKPYMDPMRCDLKSSHFLGDLGFVYQEIARWDRKASNSNSNRGDVV